MGLALVALLASVASTAALGQPHAAVPRLMGGIVRQQQRQQQQQPQQPQQQQQQERQQHEALMHLRGGDGGSAVQAVCRAYTGIPVLTRSWLTLILALSGLNQVGVLAPEAIQLDAHAIAKRMQLWRLLTATSFMGGLGPQLLQKLYYLVQFGRGLEGALGFGEFARTLASCSAMLGIIFNVLGWPFLADGLVMAVTVLLCQQNPTAQMNMYGLNIPMAYMPFAQMVMSYFFSQQIPWNDIVGALVVSSYASFSSLAALSAHTSERSHVT